MCVIGARLVGNDPAAREAAELHTARPVSPDLIAVQDLIITAARLERSQIAKMDPSSRGKTFTLREAVALGEAGMTVPERRQFERSAAAGVAVAAAYADLLNGRRGRVLPPKAAGMRLPWQPAANPMDVPDIHGAGSRRHHAQLRALRGYTAAFAGQLGGVRGTVRVCATTDALRSDPHLREAPVTPRQSRSVRRSPTRAPRVRAATDIVHRLALGEPKREMLVSVRHIVPAELLVERVRAIRSPSCAARSASASTEAKCIARSRACLEEPGVVSEHLAVERHVIGDRLRCRRPSRAEATGWCRRPSVRARTCERAGTARRADPGRRRRRGTGCAGPPPPPCWIACV